jgi:hypothetical protein
MTEVLVSNMYMHAWIDGEMTAKTSSYSFCDDDESDG